MSSNSTTLKQQIDIRKQILFLQETEDSWETISHCINSLCDVCRNGAFDFAADLIPIIQSISRPLTNAMNSERTRLSGTAMDLVSVLASGLGAGFDPLLPIFFPVLLTLCSRTNKVVIVRARTCIFTIVEATQLPSILPYFLRSIKEKSAHLRLVAVEGTLMCMNCFNPPDLEKERRALDIEAIIRATARDAHADVRRIGKKVFGAYKLLLPSRVESFVSPLTPTIKKYLDIKNIVTSSQPALAPLISTIEVKSQLSSSTSALSSAALEPSYPRTHARSASSASSSNDQRQLVTRARPARQIPRKASDSEIPPPQYVPVRPMQSSNTISVSRKASSCKKMASGSVPSGTGSSGAVESAFPVRPTSASELHDPMRRPHGSSMVPGPSDERATSGPRRVPLPDEKLKESDMNKSNKGTGVPPTRPCPSHARTQLNPVPIKRAPGKSEHIPQPRGTTSNSANAMPFPSGKPSRSLYQPTQSQLSRLNAIERKLQPTTIVKPHWGQSGRSKAKSLTKPTANQLTHKIGKDHSKPRPITPSQVPLPPSPSRPETPGFPEQRSGSTTPSANHLSSPDTVSPPPSHTVETSAKTTPKAEQMEEASVRVPATISFGQVDSRDDDRERTLSPEPSPEDQVSEATLAYKTPVPLLSSADLMDIPATGTPISALLTSIQRGFLLSPSSPLSPPQSYLLQDSEGGIDLRAKVSSQTDHYEQSMLLTKKPFMFGMAGKDTDRHALSNAENLDVYM